MRGGPAPAGSGASLHVRDRLAEVRVPTGDRTCRGKVNPGRQSDAVAPDAREASSLAFLMTNTAESNTAGYRYSATVAVCVLHTANEHIDGVATSRDQPAAAFEVALGAGRARIFPVVDLIGAGRQGNIGVLLVCIVGLSSVRSQRLFSGYVCNSALTDLT